MASDPRGHGTGMSSGPEVTSSTSGPRLWALPAGAQAGVLWASQKDPRTVV